MDGNGQFVLITRSAKDKDWDRLVDKGYAAVSSGLYHTLADSPRLNPAEPWTGVWDIKI